MNLPDSRMITVSQAARLPLLGGQWTRGLGLPGLEVNLKAQIFVRLYPIDQPELGFGSEDWETAIRLELAPLLPLLGQSGPRANQNWSQHLNSCQLPDWACAMAQGWWDYGRTFGFPTPAGFFFQTYSDLPPGVGFHTSLALRDGVFEALYRYHRKKPQDVDCFKKSKQAKTSLQSTLTSPLSIPRNLALIAWPADRLPDEVTHRFLKFHLACEIGRLLLAGHLGQSWKTFSEVPTALLLRLPDSVLPEKIQGREVASLLNSTLKRGSVSPRLDSGQIYPVREAIRALARERLRRECVQTLLMSHSRLSRAEATAETGQSLGHLMLQSHEEANQQGLGLKEADQIIDLIVERGVGKGFYGARLVGIGPTGFTVAVLIERKALGKLRWLHRSLYFSPEGPWPLFD